MDIYGLPFKGTRGGTNIISETNAGARSAIESFAIEKTRVPAASLNYPTAPCTIAVTVFAEIGFFFLSTRFMETRVDFARRSGRVFGRVYDGGGLQGPVRHESGRRYRSRPDVEGQGRVEFAPGANTQAALCTDQDRALLSVPIHATSRSPLDPGNALMVDDKLTGIGPY